MNLRTCLLASLFALGACVTDAPSDLELAEDDAAIPALVDGKADGWSVSETFHVGEGRFDTAAVGGRRVFPMWIAGTPSSPVTIDLRATATAGHDVRITVLGPLVNGKRVVLGADGYATRDSDVGLRVKIRTSGEHLIVVGSYELASETFFDVSAHCAANCDEQKLDVLATPKVGALVGTNGDRLVSATLGSALANRTFDVEMELWASPPAQPWSARKLGTSVASGNQVNAIVPADVAAGDDLRIVVREAGGRVLDSGVTTRFFPQATAFARLDSILYGDLVSLEISGVAPFYEGQATLALRSVARDVEIAQHTIVADLPGMVGNGYGAFDATFAPELEDAHGMLNPNLPRNGEVLSVGFIGGGDGEYRPLGCFEYCNDLSGMETCTGGPRTCP